MSSERSSRTYHVQLRQFPHNHCRFNLSERELAPIAERWAHDQWIDFGERRWRPGEAQLTILAGAPLAVTQLAMGRGWRAAERNGEDVTASVLASAGGAEVEAPPRGPATGDPRAAASDGRAAADRALLADSVGLELLELLDSGAAPLAGAWRLAAERLEHASASESLALAELSVRSLLERGLVSLVFGALERDAQASQVPRASAVPLSGHALDAALRAPESWAEDRPAEYRFSLRRS